jgi:predicted permease
MQTLWQDVAYALRTLRRNRGLTAVAVLTLALGIGANSAIFSFINSVLLVPLPVHDPARVATIFTSDFSGPLYGASSYPDYEDIRGRGTAFDDVAAVRGMATVLRHGDESFRARAEAVSAGYFSLLGVRAALGRPIVESDFADGAERVAVLSDAFWRRRFGGDPGVVGRPLHTSDGKSARVVGVLAPGFDGLVKVSHNDIWIPLPGDVRRDSRGLRLVARLKPGVEMSAAQANLDVIARQLHEAHGQAWSNVRGEPRRLSLLPESQSRLPPAFQAMGVRLATLVFAVSCLVILIACANVANLLLARAVERRREIAVRVSMGATRGRLIRQLITENVVLAVLAGAASLLLGVWMRELMRTYLIPAQMTGIDPRLDVNVMAFTFAVAVVTAFVFGLAPAVEATRPRVAAAIESGGRRRATIRGTLLVSQVALSVVLLVGSGLFLRSLSHAYTMDLGFDADGVMTAEVDLSPTPDGPPQRRETHRRLLERVRSLPSVHAAALASNLPLASTPRTGVRPEGYPPQPGEDMEVAYSVVTPGFFETLRIPIRRGRSFTDEDARSEARVALVNEAFVARYWPGQDAIGRRLFVGNDTALEVVGVAATGKYRNLREEPTPYVFFNHAQRYSPRMTLLVRSSADTAAIATSLRHEVRALAPAIPAPDTRSLFDASGAAFYEIRTASTMLGIFGAVALALTVIGLYGVVAYATQTRARELGVRMALGADRGRIERLIVGQALRVVWIGLGIGLLAAAGMTRLVTHMLHDVSPLDPATFVAIAALMLAAGVATSWVPAVRASRVSPAAALRYE